MKFTGARTLFGLVATGVLVAGLATTPGAAQITTTDHGHAETKFDRHPSAAEVAEVDRELKRWAATQPREAVSATSLVYIPVYVHNFYDRDNRAGYLTGDQIWAQLRWLNHSYEGGQGGVATRYRFTLKGYERIPLADSRVYFDSDGDPTTRTANLMRSYHRGGKGYLNIWTGLLRPDGIAGVARFPWEQAATPNLDGIWVDKSAWRGTADGPACTSQGDTTVHEVGHWLGLLHTDTSPVCGSQTNFMSYGTDASTRAFSSGQRDRMNLMWARYRS